MEMNIWQVTFDLHWTYMDDGDYCASETYTVIAGDYDSALETAKQIALSETYFEEEEKKDYSVTAVRLTEIHRGDYVDGIATKLATA